MQWAREGTGRIDYTNVAEHTFHGVACFIVLGEPPEVHVFDPRHPVLILFVVLFFAIDSPLLAIFRPRLTPVLLLLRLGGAGNFGRHFGRGCVEVLEGWKDRY